MPAGRPRSEAARVAMLAATREELAERGYDKLSFDRVAATAGVAKQTIYRSFPSKSALVAACLLEGYVLTPRIEVGYAGGVRSDVAAWVHGFAESTHDPQVRALIRAASSASAEDPEIARGFQSQVNTLTRDALVARLSRGIEAGELRETISPESVAQTIVGTLLYRLVTHEELSQNFVDDVLEIVFSGIVR